MKYSTKITIAALVMATGAQIAQAQGMHNEHNIQPTQNGHNMHSNTTQAATVQGSGVVKSIDLQRMRITIAHEPIAALNWPAMVMPFAVENKELLEGLKTGDYIMFDLKDEQIITSVKVVPAK